MISILSSFGFSRQFCDWIRTIQQSARILILFNGSPFCYFSCSSKVHQRDSLYSLLFGLAEDYISRLLANLVASRDLLYIASSWICYTPLYLIYADDLLLFCIGTSINL